MELAKPRRVHLMDELRGVLIIGVVLYHLLYDLAVLFPVGIPWMFSDWMNSVRNICAGALIVVSGISCHYTRSNWRRGLRAFGLGMLLTVVTALFIPSQLILFGILHFFGSMMMLYALLQPLLEKVPTMAGLLGSTLLFFLTWPIFSGFIRVLGVTVYLPEFLYNKPLLFPLGFACQGIASADYYPLIPWGFLFLAGSFFGRYVRAGRLPEFCYRSHLPLLARIGNHTMLIYLVHQPVIYGLLALIFH
ncbi:MAG: DUF1624 domain-containing protein [Angelakisella sp.]|jgi:uncharacterized membrane protein|nr:DUF1624 domain-containing protein [Angelakisella sp.]